MKIYYWPDGTYCEPNELEEYNWKSDDYEPSNVPDWYTADDIQRYVDKLNGNLK